MKSEEEVKEHLRLCKTRHPHTTDMDYVQGYNEALEYVLT